MTPPAAAAARSPAFVTAPFVPLRTGYTSRMKQYPDQQQFIRPFSMNLCQVAGKTYAYGYMH